jgi:hypothetical protein
LNRGNFEEVERAIALHLSQIRFPLSKIVVQGFFNPKQSAMKAIPSATFIYGNSLISAMMQQ